MQKSVKTLSAGLSEVNISCLSLYNCFVAFVWEKKQTLIFFVGISFCLYACIPSIIFSV